ncbi:NAD(P)/FAD-dependent oxidoreductase [Microvirga sp. 17 mud 1-3]|uniref:NAD(P)/FAD-dependent oxidoreductase n=1 Tax=Microvirga sp. 17 mud 1-3 TaxID=2082949 RepID=UPI000D6C0DC8|nr:NAD(P)/FAD-dependent oxidoreductase [Microvirga sp. 17 mud 1-3]AWM86528.1 NAD(P)/FAD-dependent oxidoreductase [Microvirga sp. 17 mud 1-3]
MGSDEKLLDCLIVGGGPAGLTAALYLARLRRNFVLIDSGAQRAAWIPKSHNIPVFASGISGPDLLARQRDTLAQYGVAPTIGTVSGLRRQPDRFVAVTEGEGGSRQISARYVLLATGGVDIEPDLPDLPNAIQRGLVRYCPICDGYESRDRRIAVIGYGDRGLGEAIFIARTYSRDVTLLTLGQPLEKPLRRQGELDALGVKVVEAPVERLDLEGDRIAALHAGGKELHFDVLYSALGLKYRSDLALSLDAEHDPSGGLIVDGHCQTSVKGLYAAGDIVRGLDQIVVAMGHAAMAAIHIHNRCELPTEDEPDGA